MEQKFNYRLAFDIGISSVGWALLQVNSNDEPVHIIDLGVRIFDKAEHPKTGASLALPRREARSLRRTIRRRRHRIARVKHLLEQNGWIVVSDFDQRYYSENLPNVYQLRSRGLDQLLSAEEFAQVLVFFAKHRGFKSNRKADKKEKENSAMLTNIHENEKKISESGYRTVGEMIYKDSSFHTETPWENTSCGYRITPKNKGGEYQHTVSRDMLVDEIHKLFEAQRFLGNTFAGKEIEDQYLEIMTSQRSFDGGPGNQADGTPSPYAIDGYKNMIGKCTLEPDEYRAPKASYSAELFTCLQKINNLRLTNKYGECRDISAEERKAIAKLLYKKRDVKYADVRKTLKAEDDFRFNLLHYKKDLSLEDSEKKSFASMSFYHSLYKIIPVDTRNEAFGIYDSVAEILTCYKDDAARTERLVQLGLEEGAIDQLLELDPSGFIHISKKAAGNLIPHLEEGLRYDKACEAAGYDFKAEAGYERALTLHGKEITQTINEISNPVVKRAVSQTIKVLNAIIGKYGSPQAVSIELAREMSKNFQDRNDAKKEIENNATRNEEIKETIRKTFHISSPKGQDIIKYRLWRDQDGRCMYSGESIPAADLFSGSYEVDHILPFSKSFNDSYSNKVLVCKAENQSKGNRTPYEYFGQDKYRWEEFESRVFMMYKNSPKARNLLKKHISSEDQSAFKNRNLNDTRFATTLIFNMIKNKLLFAPFLNSRHKKHVMAVNGSITAYLRKRWGLGEKDRSNDLHHAKDAVVIACVTDGNINKISRYIKSRELRYAFDIPYIDEETGEVIRQKEYSRDEWDERFGTQIPLPWNCFKDELTIRMGEEPKKFLDEHMDMDAEIDYPEDIRNLIRPIFVSRMPHHKISGQAHGETIKSKKFYDFESTKGMVVSKRKLTELKLDPNGEIKDYFSPESDPVLYNALRDQLRKYGNNAKEAFKNGFFKPKKDGSNGSPVKTVKIMEKMTSGVDVNNGHGIAANGRRVRVDVFRSNGKYYLVPIYQADVVKKELPNRACVAHKPMELWKEMAPEDFCFSLYSRDPIYIKSKKGIKASGNGKANILEGPQYFYYVSMNVSTASIEGISNDNGVSFQSLGVQSLEQFRKCEVDVLGNVSFVGKEKRRDFSERKTNEI